MDMTEKIKNITDEMISEVFKFYVTSLENTERHTKAACDEVDKFDEYCTELFQGKIEKEIELYDRMMDCAVEYEESGFIAGFRWAMGMVKEHGLVKTAEILHTSAKE